MLVDHAGQGVHSVAAGELICIALASTSTSFLLTAVSKVTHKDRAKLDAVS